MPRSKDANVSETLKFELWHTHESTTSLNGSYDAKSKYIAASSSCSRLIWIKKRLKDYGVSQNGASFGMTLYYENIIAFNFFKNSIQHSRLKHIRHHFIRSLVEDRVIEIKHNPNERQIGNIFTQDL